MKKQLGVLTMLVLAAGTTTAQVAGEHSVAVTFTGGHDTDPRDRGRPVILIAAALNVAPELFREAFSHVKPAADGREPEPEQLRLNKSALMRALSPFGVTDERLNEVSNYYRYNREHGEQVWQSSPASANATILNGAVTALTLSSGGAGYSSPPIITVPGFSDLKAKATLSFGTDLGANGSIKSLSTSSLQ